MLSISDFPAKATVERWALCSALFKNKLNTLYSTKIPKYVKDEIIFITFITPMI